jgi:hypothetical protein
VLVAPLVLCAAGELDARNGAAMNGAESSRDQREDIVTPPGLVGVFPRDVGALVVRRVAQFVQHPRRRVHGLGQVKVAHDRAPSAHSN